MATTLQQTIELAPLLFNFFWFSTGKQTSHRSQVSFCWLPTPNVFFSARLLGPVPMAPSFFRPRRLKLVHLIHLPPKDGGGFISSLNRRDPHPLFVGFLRGGTLRIPRKDWGTLRNIREDSGNHHPPLRILFTVVWWFGGWDSPFKLGWAWWFGVHFFFLESKPKGSRKKKMKGIEEDAKENTDAKQQFESKVSFRKFSRCFITEGRMVKPKTYYRWFWDIFLQSFLKTSRT